MVKTTLKTFRNTAGVAVLALGMTSLAGTAQAYDFSGYEWAMINFSDYAEQNGEGALPTNPGDISFGDITVTIQSFRDGDDWTKPYLDGKLGNKPGGLGVCQYWNGNCGGTEIEEIDEGESVKLTFSKDGEILEDIKVSDVMLRNENHDQDFDGDNDGQSDGHVIITTTDINGDNADTEFVDLAANLDGHWTGTMFTFAHNTGGCHHNCDFPEYRDFYIEKLKIHFKKDDMPGVPEPATLAMFGFGLAGIGAIRRRRTAR